MAIDKSTIEDIARLARLSVSDDESEKYASEISNILDLVATMEEVNTEGVEPMTHPFDATLRMRVDEVSESNQREQLQANAPESEKGLFLVPKVID